MKRTSYYAFTIFNMGPHYDGKYYIQRVARVAKKGRIRYIYEYLCGSKWIICPKYKSIFPFLIYRDAFFSNRKEGIKQLRKVVHNARVEKYL